MDTNSKDLFPCLNSTTAFSVRRDTSILMDLRTGMHMSLGPSLAFPLALCNGGYSMGQIVELAASLNVITQLATDEIETFLSEINGIYLHFRDTGLKDPPALADPLALARQTAAPYLNPWDSGIPYDGPVEVDLYVTERCNMSCCYCFVGQSCNSHRDTLTDDDFQDVIEQMAAIGILRCTFTGGEPTLMPGYIDLIKKTVQSGIYTTLATNGANLPSNSIDKLLDAGIGGIQISLDSADPQIFSFVTKASPAVFHEVVRAIKEVASKKIQSCVKAVLTKYNIQQIGSLIDLCGNAGVAEIKLQNYEPGLSGRGDSDLFISEREIEGFKTLVEQKRREFGNSLSIREMITGEQWKPGEFRPCRHALSGFGIFSDGSVTVCDRFGHSGDMITGNVENERLDKIWCNERHLNIVKPDVKALEEPCRSCINVSECRTGCHLYSVFSTGRPYSQDPRCRVKPCSDNGTAAYAGKIKSGGRYLFAG